MMAQAELDVAAIFRERDTGGGWELDDRILGDKAQALAQLISQTGNIPIKPNTQPKNSGLKF